MERIYITCIGCARRKLDCERFQNYFRANGVRTTRDPHKADHILISTCGLSDFHETAALRKISYLNQLKANLIVYGCLPAMNPEALDKVFAGTIIPTNEMQRMDDLFAPFTIKMRDIPDANKEFNDENGTFPSAVKSAVKRMDLFHAVKLWSVVTGVLERLVEISGRAVPENFVRPRIVNPPVFSVESRPELLSLRISTGCMGNCSYCNIKLAIGRLKSKPFAVIRKEIERGLQKKQLRYNIIASDSGSYGLDIGSDFPTLLDSILCLDPRLKIEFIQDLHPVWVCRYKKALAELIKTGRIKSVLTAVQSGNPRILRLMKRMIKVEEFASTITRFKREYPRLRLRTQVIVGFPTETDAEFRDTIDLVRKCGFDEIDIFQYVERKNMASAGFFPKVPERVIAERILKLRRSLPLGTITHVMGNAGINREIGLWQLP